MSGTELTSKVRELKELKIMADELQAEITELEDTIKTVMTERNVEQMIVDVFKVRWTPVTSNRLDSKALSNDLPDIAARYMKTTISRRFTIA